MQRCLLHNIIFNIFVNQYVLKRYSLNFLIHYYLSGNNENLILGNFITDFIRGKAKMEQYSTAIKKGILLHQFIDTFSDNHPAVRKSIERLKPFHFMYAGVAVDIMYDHFMVINWQKYHRQPLNIVSNQFYLLLEENFEMLPSRAKKIVPRMIEENWLQMYGDPSGLQMIFEGMSRRAAFKSDMDKTVGYLLLDYEKYESEFFTFMGEISKAVVKEFPQVKLVLPR